MAESTAVATSSVVERFSLKTFVESCLVLEEGVAEVKDIDLGMMTGTGIQPGPFARADARGLDVVLESLERAESEWGSNFAPPLILKRLVNQGRLGSKSGQGFFPYPQPDEEFEQCETVLLQTVGSTAIFWLNRPPANPISPQVVEDLAALWGEVSKRGDIRAVVITSSTPFTFSAGADIKAFTQMDAQKGRALLELGHSIFREIEHSSIVTIAAVNSIAFGGGNELAMACDFRVAAKSATFGQPEINLGIIPGFGGTQRLPRLVGQAKALEMNLTGEPISSTTALEAGLVSKVVRDHELLDTALAMARGFAEKAPLAVEKIKTVSNKSDLDQGIAAEIAAFSKVFASEDAEEGISAFLQKRKPSFVGR